MANQSDNVVLIRLEVQVPLAGGPVVTSVGGPKPEKPQTTGNPIGFTLPLNPGDTMLVRVPLGSTGPGFMCARGTAAPQSSQCAVSVMARVYPPGEQLDEDPPCGDANVRCAMVNSL